MQKFLILFTTITALFAIPVFAQETRDQLTTISINESISGEITNRNFEVNYVFEGVAGAIAIFYVEATEEDTELIRPEIIIFDEDKRILKDTTDIYGYQESTLVMALPYTGNYTIMVTRDDGRTGESVGEYALTIIQPRTLTPGETISQTALNNKSLNYYSVKPVNKPFSLYYEFSNGELRPIIEAYRVKENGELVNVARFSGEELQSGSIGLDGTRSEIYIFTIGDSPYAYYYDDRVERADYRLRLIISE